MDADRLDRRFWWVDLLVVGLAAILRVIGLWTFESTSFALWPQVDAWTYWDQARQIFAGEDPFAAEGFYQPPGYPWFLAGVFGLAGGPSLTAARVANLALGTGSTVLVLWLGKRLGRAAGLPLVGPTAALLWTFYPRTLLFELDVLTPALSTFLILVLAIVAGRGTGPGRLLVAGLLLGLGAMVHATILVLLPILALAPLADRPRPSLRRWIVLCTALLVGTVCGLLPTAVRNWERWHTPTPVSYNAGINLYLGNNARWRETALSRAGLAFRDLALEAEPHRRSLPERDRYWMRRTLDEVLASPGGFATGLATKALWSVNRREIPRNEDLDCRTREGPTRWIGWMPVRWWWAFPSGVLGFVVLWRRAGAAGRVLPWLWLALHGVQVLFLPSDRYRVIGMPFLLLGAAAVPGWLLVARTEARRWRVAWGAAGLAAILPWLPIHPGTAFQEAWCLHLKGNHATSAGELPEAAVLYERAVALDPRDLDARRWWAEALRRLDRPEEAEAVLAPVVAAYPGSYPVRVLAARIAAQRGDWTAAALHQGAAYRVPGPRSEAGVRYVEVLVRAGRVDEARAVAVADPNVGSDPRVVRILAGAPSPSAIGVPDP
ncbi:MAG: tetratricopeptide repeat protein [Deltaproteobacteria bacterium]|nr:tetratricopeptide repeat protein [Deltaproteobacteria bacterium]